MNYFTIIITTLVSFYVLLLAIVFFFQRSFLYHPSIDNYLKDHVINEPSEIEKVKITTDDNIKLVAWFYNKDIKNFVNLNYLVVDCLRIDKHPSHYNLEDVLKLIDILKPKKSILTNLHTDLDYNYLIKV